jgi:hypothetical protein
MAAWSFRRAPRLARKTTPARRLRVERLDDRIVPAGTPPLANDMTVAATEDIALDFTVAASDPDAQDTVSVLDVQFPAGQPAFGVTPIDGQPLGLRFVAPGNFSGQLTAQYRVTDGTLNSDFATITFNVAAVADAPSISVTNIGGQQGTFFLGPISGALTDTDGSESLSFQIYGLPDDDTLSAGVKQPDGSWLLQEADLPSLELTHTGPPTTLELGVVAIATEASNGDTATASAPMQVIIAPAFASTPVVTAPASIAGDEGTAIPLAISVTTPFDLFGNDTPSALIRILDDQGNLTAGTLSAGTQAADGTWTLSAADLVGLTVTLPDGPANYEIEVVGVSTNSYGGSQAEAVPDYVQAAVANVRPSLNLDTTPANPDEGSPFTRAGSFTDPGSDTWTVIANYGDGTGDQVLALDGKHFNLGHAYADNGNYTITVGVADDDMAAGDFVIGSIPVVVNNVGPIAAPAASDPAYEGNPVTLSLTNPYDPSPVDTTAGFRYSFDFDNDGVWDVTDQPAASAAHTFAEPGQYTVQARIKDKDGASSTYSFPVSVADAPLSAAGETGRADISTQFRGRVATFTDLNPQATTADYRVTITWPDQSQTAGSLTRTGPGAFEVSGNHLFTRPGKSAVAVAIADTDGATTSATAAIWVHAAPVVRATGLPLGLVEGATYVGGIGWFTVSTPTARPTDYNAIIAWGDGRTTPGHVVAGLHGRLAVVGSHTYKGPGPFTIHVTILDPADGTAMKTFDATAVVSRRSRLI